MLNLILIIKILKSKASRVSDIWDWASNYLAPNTISPSWYNGAILNQTYLINDVSSIIFGYAVIKQKRIKQSESFSTIKN